MVTHARSLLVVDDDEDYRAILASFLEAEGFAVVQATDGCAGLAEAMHGSFDAILLDQRMPGLSGLEVAERLRRLAVPTPIVLVTAAEDPEELARSAGIGHWLRKPFGAPAIRAVLASLAGVQ